MPPLGTTGYQTESQAQGMGYFFGVTGHRGLIDPQTLHAISYALGYPPQSDHKILFLKTPHA